MKKRTSPPADAAELRRQAEKRLRERKNRKACPAAEQDTQRQLHELQVHQIELEMQNDELAAARAAVEAGLERYADLYDFAPVGYLTLGRNGAIRQSNLMGASLLGVERATLTKRRFAQFVSEADCGAFRAFLTKAFDGQAPAACEVALQVEEVPSGSSQGSVKAHLPRYVRIEASVAGDGQTCRLVATDITEHRRAEETLRRLAAKTQEAQKLESMGVLAGGIAHDLNNLLAAVMGNAQLAIQELAPGTSARAKIERIVASAERAAELAEQVLAFSGKGQFAVQPVGLSKLVRGTNRLLKATVSGRCSLAYDLGQGLPAVEVDPNQIQRVAVALILNASEAIGQRRGVISVSTGVTECDPAYLTQCLLGEDLAPGSYVYLEVKDSGCGMAPEVQARLFEPFFSTKAFGRGLGLSAVMGIVRSHHGAIRVASKPGGGSTFRILLPAAEPVAPLASVSKLAKAATLAGGAGKVLVVDDEDDIREVAQDILQFAGFTVLTAAGGRAAVEVYREHVADIDAVLLDLTMPDMDGYETFGELRRIRKDIPILLCSGYSLENVQERFGNEAMPDFLKKPFQLEELVEAMNRVMQGSSHTPAGPASTTPRPKP